MTIFQVGEAVRIVLDPSTTDAAALATDGEEGLVTRGLAYHASSINGVDVGNIWGYGVIAQSGIEILCEPHELRKRHPPSTDESESRQAMLDCIERAKRGVEVPA